MNERRPQLVVLAGPNGAGKSTFSCRLPTFDIDEFVNADLIARGLSAFHPERVAMLAGRIMLDRIRSLAMSRADFAFETTLATRSFAPWIRQLTDDGYAFHLVYLWLRSPDLAVERVAERVRAGGHSVAEEDVRRRYRRSLKNFFDLYQPLTTTWRIFDNSIRFKRSLIAAGRGVNVKRVADQTTWQRLLEQHQ